MIILNAPRFDADSERWIEPVKGLKLKVGSISNPAYRSHNAMVRRHIEKVDARFNVGTDAFNPAELGEIDSLDDLLIDSVAKYLLLDWQGVGELDEAGKEAPIEYSPEHGAVLLRQKPELYWSVLSAAVSISEGKEEQKKATVGKQLKRKLG